MGERAGLLDRLARKGRFRFHVIREHALIAPPEILGERAGLLDPIPVNESQKLVKSKVVSNIGSLFNLNSSRPTR